VILLEESRLNRVVDPAGGGWFVESMTDELAEKAWAMFQEIESRGGMAEALTRGWIADQIESAFAPRLANIARRKDAVTGVSEYPNLTEASVERESPDLRKLRGAAAAELADRTGDLRAESLSAAVEAAADGATIGQLARAMWKDGDGVTIAPLTPNPYARPFEELRDASDLTLAETGQRPKVFLANMGPIAHHTARATFSKNFFEAGGFAVESNNGFDSADAAAEAFRQSGANIAVICSSDKLYPQFVPHVAPGLKQAGARTVILAGHPGDQEAAYRKAGVDRFIYIKVDVLETLRDLLREEGVID
jgi:methylmalonyl-CoA mutase